MTHYDTLEVSPKASAEVIRAAYKSLMQRHHPDKQTDASQPNPRAAFIAQAYGVLGDPVKRAAYDLEILQRPEPLPPAATLASVAHAKRRPSHRAQQRNWRGVYAWGLILFILVAGWLLLKQPKPTRPKAISLTDSDLATRTAPVASAPATPASDAAEASLSKTETPEQRAARTLTSFATNLTVELTGARPASQGSPAVLTIPDLVIRVGTADPARWVQRITERREAVLRALLADLSMLRREDLAQADGDLELQRVIVASVMQTVGLTLQGTVAPLEVSLPQGFLLR